MALKAITVPLDVDDLAVMKKAIEDGRGNDGIPEEFLPVPEAFIRGEDRGAFLITTGDKLEEKIGIMGGYRQVTNFINNNDGGVQVGLALGLAFPEFTDQGVHGGKIDLESVVTGLDGQGDGEVGFPHSGRTQKDHVFMFVNKRQIEEFHDRFPV